MTLHDRLASAALGMVAGAVYGGVWFARAHARDGEPFDKRKFAATIIVSAAVGLGMGLADAAVTEQSVEHQLMMYAGVIAIVEGLLKTFTEEVKSRREGR